MLIVKVLFFTVVLLAVLGLVDSRAEIIYFKDGRIIKADIVAKTRDTVWYELQLSSGSGRAGVDIGSIAKILNDDGTISHYSPTSSMDLARPKEKPPAYQKEASVELKEIATDRPFKGPGQTVDAEGPPEQKESTGEKLEDSEALTPRDILYGPEPRPAETARAMFPFQVSGDGEVVILGRALEGFKVDKLLQMFKGPALLSLIGMLSGMFAVLLMPFLIIALPLYVYFSICLQTIAKRTDTPHAWLAWIPVINFFLMVNIANRPKSWMCILTVILLLNLTPLTIIIGGLGLAAFNVILWRDIAKARNKPAWVGMLITIPIIQVIIPGYLAFSE